MGSHVWRRPSGAAGRLSGRAQVTVGNTNRAIIAYSDPDGVEPEKWILALNDPNGGGVVRITQGHNEVSMEQSPVVTTIGYQVIKDIVGSSICVDYTSAYDQEISFILCRATG